MTTTQTEGEGQAAQPKGGRVDLPSFSSLATAVAVVSSPVAAAVYGVVWVAHQEYYRPLGLTPAAVGLGQVGVVSRLALLMGIIAFGVAAWVGFGVVAYRLSAPVRAAELDSERRLRQWLIVIAAYAFALLVAAVVPAFLIARLAGGPSLRVWTWGIVVAAALAIELSWFLGDRELAIAGRLDRAARALYAGRLPAVGSLLLFSLIGGLLVVWTSNLVVHAERAGRVVLATGALPDGLYWYLDVQAAPARVVPKGEDPLKICDGSRQAVLMGRHGGDAFVLMLPTSPGGHAPEVLPLEESEYAVVTGKSSPETCSPP